MPAKLTWYGHAAFRLDLPDHALLIDPYLSDNPSASAEASEVEGDYLLISHGHSDHVGDSVDIAKRTDASVISNFEIVNWFAEKGIEGHPQHLGGGYHHPFGYLKLTLALHGSALPDGSYGGNPAGFLLTTNEGEKIYFACDTGLFGDMALIGEEGVDLAVLPIGDNFTMGPDDALRAVQLIDPQHVIPVHYNTFEPIQQDPHAWAERVRTETNTTPQVLTPGDSFSL